MSMHQEDWENLWKKVRDWAKTHQTIAVGAGCVVAGIVIGLLLR